MRFCFFATRSTSTSFVDEQIIEMNVDKEAFIKAICEGKLDDVERILASGSDNAARLLRYVYGDRKVNERE